VTKSSFCVSCLAASHPKRSWKIHSNDEGKIQKVNEKKSSKIFKNYTENLLVAYYLPDFIKFSKIKNLFLNIHVFFIGTYLNMRFCKHFLGQNWTSDKFLGENRTGDKKKVDEPVIFLARPYKRRPL